MKRELANLDQFYDVEKDKYEIILLDHLQLQKELVWKRRKLYAAKQKRLTLLAEVRFLKRRHKYLLQTRSSDVEADPNQTHDANFQRKKLLESERNRTVDDAPSCNPCSVLVSHSDSLSVEEPNEEGGDKIGRMPLRKKHKANKLFDNRRSVLWHNKTSLETIKEEDEEVEQEEQTGHELPKIEKLRNCWTNEKRIDQITCL